MTPQENVELRLEAAERAERIAGERQLREQYWLDRALDAGASDDELRLRRGYVEIARIDAQTARVKSGLYRKLAEGGSVP